MMNETYTGAMYLDLNLDVYGRYLDFKSNRLIDIYRCYLDLDL